MSIAKVRALYVRPFQSADLSFETAGILGQQDLSRVSLGSHVYEYDFAQNLLTTLKRREADESGRLYWDAGKIHEELSKVALFSLRNETLETNLQQAISQRELAFLENFKHKTEILDAVADLYPTDTRQSGKLKRLNRLKRDSERLTEALKTAYENNSRTEVVTEVESLSENTGSTTATTLLTPISMKTPAHQIQVRDSPANSNHNVPETTVIPQQWNGSNFEELHIKGMNFESQRTQTVFEDYKQKSSTRNPEFRHPFLENLIHDQRVQLELQDEMLVHKLAALVAGDIDAIMDKELEIIDLEILKAQLRFAQTYLVSPISGVITAIYKDLGEAVQPGEPVIRVENYEKVLIVGLIQHRSAITLGRPVQIMGYNLYESDFNVTVTGKVVSIRGHDADDDEWDIIIESDNSVGLPINYHFDRDTTTVTIL